jgi:hypothetical protein
MALSDKAFSPQSYVILLFWLLQDKYIYTQASDQITAAIN